MAPNYSMYRPSGQQPYPQGIALPRSNVRRQTPQQKMVEGLVQPEVWVMYDTLIYNTGNTFANAVASNPFFASRTFGSNGSPISSMTTNSGYVDFPFKAYGIGVEVWCDSDAAAAAGIATASSFVEIMTQYASVELRFATDLKFVAPVSDLPAGGGIVYASKIRTQASAANSDSCGASNGLQSVQARVLWKDYILFRGKDTPFTVNLVLQQGTPSALARLQALQALTSNFQAGVRIKFWGYRGKSLITGAPFRG